MKRSPLRIALTHYWRPILVALGVSTIGCVLSSVFVFFLPGFAARALDVPTSATFMSTLVHGVIYLVLTPVMGFLSDRIGRKPFCFAVSGGSIVLGYPLFLLLISMHSVTGLILTQAIATVILTLYTGPICAFLAEMFPTSIRYTALSISIGFAVAIFGGFAPLIATALIQTTGNALAPGYYVMAAGVLSFVATLFVKERAGLPMAEEGETSAQWPRANFARGPSRRSNGPGTLMI